MCVIMLAGLAVTLNPKTRTVGALRISRARPPKIPHVKKLRLFRKNKILQYKICTPHDNDLLEVQQWPQIKRNTSTVVVRIDIDNY